MHSPSYRYENLRWLLMGQPIIITGNAVTNIDT
jgi:hypothetical protein